MSHVTYRSRQQYLCFLTLDVTVLVPVGTQLHGQDSHAGLAASWEVGIPTLVLASSPVGTWPQWQDSHAGSQMQRP